LLHGSDHWLFDHRLADGFRDHRLRCCQLFHCLFRYG
jgi:hypothetical protein